MLLTLLKAVRDSFLAKDWFGMIAAIGDLAKYIKGNFPAPAVLPEGAAASPACQFEGDAVAMLNTLIEREETSTPEGVQRGLITDLLGAGGWKAFLAKLIAQLLSG